MIKRNELEQGPQLLQDATKALTEILEAAHATRTAMRKLNSPPMQSNMRVLYSVAAGTPSLLAIMADEVLYGRFISGLSKEVVSDLRMLYARLTARIGGKALQMLASHFADAAVIYYTNPQPQLATVLVDEFKSTPYLVVLPIIEQLNVEQVRRAGVLL